MKRNGSDLESQSCQNQSDRQKKAWARWPTRLLKNNSGKLRGSGRRIKPRYPHHQKSGGEPPHHQQFHPCLQAGYAGTVKGRQKIKGNCHQLECHKNCEKIPGASQKTKARRRKEWKRKEFGTNGLFTSHRITDRDQSHPDKTQNEKGLKYGRKSVGDKKVGPRFGHRLAGLPNGDPKKDAAQENRKTRKPTFLSRRN